MNYIVEYRYGDQQTWSRWGSGNTPRTAEVSEAYCIQYLEDLEPDGDYETRIRKQ